MIQHLTHVFTDLETLLSEISSGPIACAAEQSQAQLIQIYCAEADKVKIAAITALIASKLPTAVVVGASSAGEVAQGRLMTHQTVIGFTFFASSRVSVVAMACEKGHEHDTGAEIGRRLSHCAPDIAGVLLLATVLSTDAAALLGGIESTCGGYPIFGGGAGDYAAMSMSLVFSGPEQFNSGVVAVAFSGNDLHIESTSFLGWSPLSRAMRITQADDQRVLRIDGRPAFDIYQHYLDIPNDENFYANAMEFPLLLERDGELLARVPVAADEQGALQFVADIHEGEVFRIGYGNIALIVKKANELHHLMMRFCPQAIFLYTCACRRLLMQEAVDLETLPLEEIAPTFGFYTYGEFSGSSHLNLLNSTIVAVGLREGPKPPRESMETSSARVAPLMDDDPYANKHARVVSRLLRFSEVVTLELEASIREVTKLSITDRLTQLVNRTRLDQVLDEQVKHASRYGQGFAVILLDVDNFKQVNDIYSHLVGDDVLVQVARVLEANTRIVDVVGRWGGEEFLVIAPNTSIDTAALVAEKLRLAMERNEHPIAGRRTCSFGVTEYTQGDSPDVLVARADAALYAAKKAGRNRVEIGCSD